MNEQSMSALINACRNDPELIDLLSEILKHFEDYHRAIIALESYAALHDYANTDRDQYREQFEGMDAARTRLHNVVLDDMRLLNKLADSFGLSPVYDGVISADRPYRRQVANAALAYLEHMITERR